MLRILHKIILLAAATTVLAVMMTATGVFSGHAADGGTLLHQFFISGGPIVWFILLPMSLVMVYLAVEQALIIRRKSLLPDGIAEKIKSIIRQQAPEQLKIHLILQRDIISKAIAKTLAALPCGAERIRSVLSESFTEQGQLMLRRTEWLNLIGNISPMVGLFGTVVGMIQLFNTIVVSGGQPQPAQLAGGISVALVTTFWGLLIAIPALAIHSILRSRIESIIADAAAQAEEILFELLRTPAKQNQTPVAGSAQSSQGTRIVEFASKPASNHPVAKSGKAYVPENK